MDTRCSRSCARVACRDLTTCGIAALTVILVSLTPDAAAAEGWVSIGPSNVGMVTSRNGTIC
jgi:hypothetical protein